MCYNSSVGMLQEMNSNSVYTLGIGNGACPFLLSILGL